jgi:hypothetical protein
MFTEQEVEVEAVPQGVVTKLVAEAVVEPVL